MSEFQKEPCRWLADSTNAENEIRDIFYQHWLKLGDRMMASVNEINAWRQKLMADINKHADDQIANLGKEYDCLRLVFNVKLEENLDTTRAYAAAQNGELYDELRNACRTLEFQVAQLEMAAVTMNAPRIITVQEQIERKKNVQLVALNSDNNRSDEILVPENTNNPSNNKNQTEDVLVKLESSIANETLILPSTTESSIDNNNQLTDNNNVSQTHIVNSDGSMSKCPICFMIFPLTMTEHERTQHVNEHYGDN